MVRASKPGPGIGGRSFSPVDSMLKSSSVLAWIVGPGSAWGSLVGSLKKTSGRMRRASFCDASSTAVLGGVVVACRTRFLCVGVLGCAVTFADVGEDGEGAFTLGAVFSFPRYFVD